MLSGRPSRTAEYMALFRAVESCEPAERRLFDDPYAAAFLTPGLRAVASAARLPGVRSLVARLIDRRSPGSRVSALVRTRLIDEALVQALARGVGQVVLLGAGYDSRPYRIGGVSATRVFEVDHPTTQSAKRERLAGVLGSIPQNVAWVPVDFLREDFGTALAKAGYEEVEPAFFIWEGVSNYLTAAAVDHTLGWIAMHSARGSLLSFTYVDRGLLDGSVSFPGSERWVQAVNRAGEPFTFGLVPGELEAYLAGRRLRLVSDVSTAEALTGADGGDARLPIPPAFYHVAMAEVMEHAGALSAQPPA